jgi:ASC-1-like (ASCH) protein
MRTSLNNIKAIDDYLLGRMAPGDALLFEANMLLNNDLINDIEHQQRAYSIIREYSIQNIRAEIRAVQKTLATAPQHRSFMHRITHLFKNQ